MKPLNGHIQIEFKSPEETTVSGIILATAPDATEEGKIIHTGESNLEVGTMVLFKSYSLIEFKRREKDTLHFVRTEDIIAAYDPSL